ncbi:MAG: hypothetical protein HFE27_02355 [Clostridia bacterium]|nr:hypothetical protein [Clostridia bacterium]
MRSIPAPHPKACRRVRGWGQAVLSPNSLPMFQWGKGQRPFRITEIGTPISGGCSRKRELLLVCTAPIGSSRIPKTRT